jgi:CDP-glucose 4,6-dehydratase
VGRGQGALEGVVSAPGGIIGREAWNGRRVFVTGHTGFKGAWLSLWLQRMGAEVTGFALEPPTRPSLFALAEVGKGMRDVRGDVRDLPALTDALRDSRAEVVLHLAAQSLVRASYDDPVGTYATNVMGTVNLLEAARRSPGVRAVVVVTSDKCYENREWLWAYRENEPMGGRDPYASSKGCAELVTAAYRASFFAADAAPLVATGRAGNVIGGGDWARDRLVPDAMTAFADGRPLAVRHPHAVRPWQHVLAPLYGYLLLAERLLSGERAVAEGWNFGPADEDARSVAEIVAGLARRWGTGARWSVEGGEHPHEASYLKLDSSKARSLLGYHPRLPLDVALDWVVEWTRGWAAEPGAARRLTLGQIERFEGLQA